MAMVNGHIVSSRRLTKKMFIAQDGKCGYCGGEMYLRSAVSRKYRAQNKSSMATFDHIVPVSNGGILDLKNGVCACHECNNLKANLSVTEFFERYEELRQYLNEKPQRDAAKAAIRKQKQIYIIARFAVQLGKTVEDLLLEFLYNSREEMMRTL